MDSILRLCWILCWCTFGSFTCFWTWHQVLGTGWEAFRCLLANFRQGCHLPFTKEWLPSDPSCFCTLPQICALRQLCLGSLETVPLTSRLVCALTCTVNCGTLYRQVCLCNSCPTNWVYRNFQEAPELKFEVHGKSCKYLYTYDFPGVFFQNN